MSVKDSMSIILLAVQHRLLIYCQAIYTYQPSVVEYDSRQDPFVVQGIAQDFEMARTRRSILIPTLHCIPGSRVAIHLIYLHVCVSTYIRAYVSISMHFCIKFVAQRSKRSIMADKGQRVKLGKRSIPTVAGHFKVRVIFCDFTNRCTY